MHFAVELISSFRGRWNWIRIWKNWNWIIWIIWINFWLLVLSDRWRATEAFQNSSSVSCGSFATSSSSASSSCSFSCWASPSFHIWHFRWALKVGVIASSIQDSMVLTCPSLFSLSLPPVSSFLPALSFSLTWLLIYWILWGWIYFFLFQLSRLMGCRFLLVDPAELTVAIAEFPIGMAVLEEREERCGRFPCWVALGLLWKCSENALKLLWNCSETALGVSECDLQIIAVQVAIGVELYFSQICLKLLWNCS